MLPVVFGNKVTSQEILYYTLVLIPATLVLVYPLGVMGALYGTIALILGIVFVKKSWELIKQPEDYQTARSLFKYSIVYMMLLCAGMMVDSLPIFDQMNAQFSAWMISSLSA